MLRPRGSWARTVYDKVERDKKLEALDKNLWYAINEMNMECLSVEILRKFEKLDFDESAKGFIERCVQNSDAICWQVWLSLASTLLSFFLSPTSINGLLGRGSMYVFSESQFKRLVNFEDGVVHESLLDIGAGDGSTTSMMQNLFSKVYVTEMSIPMKSALAQKGFTVLDEKKWSTVESDNLTFSVISSLNVLDRCNEPLKLLNDIKRKLSPGGLAIVAFVIPFKPYVEFENKNHEPIELLPISSNSFEGEIFNFVTKVLEPNGWELIRWSRVPYLCDGDIRQAYYWLSDAVFVIRPIENLNC